MTYTFKAKAYYNSEYLGSGKGAEAYRHHPDQPRGFEAIVYFDTSKMTDEQRSDLVALHASFPKWLNVKHQVNAVHIQVRFSEVKGNDKNETGIKRVRKFLELANTEWTKESLNGYATVEEFLAAL